MDLWNDYEGKTIAESFPLEKLLYPEGRNGFFSTWNGTGTPAVIRLTESLNDQDEMLEQWSIVRGLNHPNLILIKKSGHTVVDDTPLVYAVMEPSDASLAEMLRERCMTHEETLQIATSLTAALQALHGAGLVHGHIDPLSVFAVGEVVKLRSDCATKRIDPGETQKLQAADVKDMAALLLQALTLRRDRQPGSLQGIAPPLDQIIRHGLDGSWGLDNIAQALNPGKSSRGSAADRSAAVSPRPAPAVSGTASAKAAAPAVKTEKPLADSKQNELPLDFSASPASTSAKLLTGVWPWVGVAAVLLLCILGWYYLHPLTPEQKALAHSNTATAATKGSPVASLASAAPDAPAKPSPSSTPGVAPPATSAPSVTPAGVAALSSGGSSIGRDSWRVVVFTYNQEGQARKKVADITRHHQSMRPEVFTPTGQAPYLVTLGGGSMDHEQAATLQRKARSQGFPRDTYVQNYTAR